MDSTFIPITYLIIGFTCLITWMAFNNPEINVKMKHWPFEEKRRGEYFRWLTAGFLHADLMHLLFNMLTLYFFGTVVEMWFGMLFPGYGKVLFILFYLAGIAVPSYATYTRYKDSPSFASIGASGAVSAVLFASILLMPTMGVMMFFIPIPIPGFIFGAIYLFYSDYAARKGQDNIDHLAHFIGAVFGFFFPILLKPDLFFSFLSQIRGWFSSF